MAHALSTASASPVLSSHPNLRFQNGDTGYRIDKQGDQVIYQVRRGSESLALPIQWAFGAGKTGQTFVYRKDGALYEARVSFFRSKNGLDITNGHWYLPDTTISEAAGRRLSQEEAARCFGCHTSPAGTSSVAGVQCSACHEDGETHAASFEKGGTPFAPSLQMANVCGRCHRTEAPTQGVENVRFQPYRLMGSHCFRANDERISCVACHNPHEEVQRTAEFYDSKCQACHASAGFKVCRVAKQGCTGCHMPKVEVPEMHDQFTDHRIRIVHKGDAYPG
jgi:hypothetical protein